MCVCVFAFHTFVTVTKSDPRKTRVTPSILKSRIARGESIAARADAKSLERTPPAS